MGLFINNEFDGKDILYSEDGGKNMKDILKMENIMELE